MQSKLEALKRNFLIGEFLWQERHHQGLSYTEVNGYTGLAEDDLRQYEKGTLAIPVNLLYDLAHFYNVERRELQYFLEYVNEKAKQPWNSRDYTKLFLHRFKVL